MRIAITTLGCKVNQSESASMAGILKAEGHEIVSEKACPDICIVNTCTVTAKSDYQSRQFIRRAIKSGAKVIATGCYAQLRSEELLKINGLSAIIGTSYKGKISNSLNNLYKNGSKPFILTTPPESPPTFQPYFSEKSRAFLKIQDGCNFSCSYCAVPMARGKSKSLTPKDVLKVANNLVENGYKEIVLTGVHIGCYGLDLTQKTSLVEIVDSVSKCHPSIRIRLSSIEPQEFKNEFLSLIKQKVICPHLHIPLQSGSDNILKAMNRGYSASFFSELIKEIASTCPDISLGTDVIVGFPGESDKDFEATRRLLEELPFSYIHIFPYSKRPGTLAESMAGQINSKIKKQRVGVLLDIAREKKNMYMLKHLGKTLDVIIESQRLGFYRGISDNYIRLLVKAENLTIGQRIQIKTISFINEGLIGEARSQAFQQF